MMELGRKSVNSSAGVGFSLLLFVISFLSGAVMFPVILGLQETWAQEANQSALIGVEKKSQEYLLAPRPLEVPSGANPEALRPSGPPLEEKSSSLTIDVLRTRLAIAWAYYNQKQYEKALRLFRDLVENSGTSELADEARLGLSYCLIRLNRLPEAVGILEELVKRGVRLQETVPVLVETLLALKRYEEAEKYLPLLP